MYFVLPNNPQTAKFLTTEERKLAFARVQGTRHSADSRKWSSAQFKEALIDPRTWLFFLLNIFTTLPGGGLTAVSAHPTCFWGKTELLLTKTPVRKHHSEKFRLQPLQNPAPHNVSRRLLAPVRRLHCCGINVIQERSLHLDRITQPHLACGSPDDQASSRKR